MSYVYFLGWYDDSRKTTTEQRISEGCKVFRERFGVMPTVVQVNPSEYVEIEGIDVQTRDYVRPNNYWIGVAPATRNTANPQAEPESVQQASLFEV